LGAALATHNGGNYSATSALGVLLTLARTFLAAFKTIATHYLQTAGSFQLPAIELLRYLPPWAAFQSGLAAYFAGEYSAIKREISPPNSSVTGTSFNLFVICNSVGAFLLSGASFEANRRAGPLSTAVVGNVKQVAMLLIVFWLEREKGRPAQLIGHRFWAH
jgi:drug/metabolite transporter (DMT)-like permease